jgi:hypothetical protein
VAANLKPKPYKQGTNNGLCSHIAVVNAVRYLFPETIVLDEDGYTEHGTDLLQRYLIRLCFRPEEFERLYLYGSEEPEDRDWSIERQLNSAIQWLKTKRELKAKQYAIDPEWRDVRKALLLAPNRVVILGMGKPWEHYTVATEFTSAKTVALFDSDEFDTADERDEWQLLTARVFERIG